MRDLRVWQTDGQTDRQTFVAKTALNYYVARQKKSFTQKFGLLHATVNTGWAKNYIIKYIGYWECLNILNHFVQNGVLFYIAVEDILVITVYNFKSDIALF